MSKVKKRAATKSAKKLPSPFNIYWEKNNYLLLLAGIVVTIIGYYLMSIGPWNSNESLVYSPIVLFIAYVIILPLAIVYRRKKQENANTTNE
jgi:FtsH-binding integral membrane protein